MSRYTLTEEADSDVERIARDSVDKWGWTQAERYVSQLHHAFETIAQFPGIGRDVSHLRDGYLRFEHASHSVFYRRMEGGILIVRILHSRMLAELHL